MFNQGRKCRKVMLKKFLKEDDTPRTLAWHDGYVKGTMGVPWRYVPHKHGAKLWHAWLEGWRVGRDDWHSNGRKKVDLD